MTSSQSVVSWRTAVVIRPPWAVNSRPSGSRSTSVIRRKTSSRMSLMMGTHARNAESFNGTLKNERVNRTEYPAREHVRKDVISYIELRYNQIRLHSGIDYRTPDGVESWFERNKASSTLSGILPAPQATGHGAGSGLAAQPGRADLRRLVRRYTGERSAASNGPVACHGRRESSPSWAPPSSGRDQDVGFGGRSRRHVPRSPRMDSGRPAH